MDDTKLVEALKMFNRKERFWLFQHAIGDHHLSDKFRADLSKKFDPLLIPADAYWAIDYHFDWIAGAITEFAGLASQFPNAPIEQEEGERKLIRGNQEDIDLLIAFDRTLILVEYKAGGDWNGQLDSKKNRMVLLEKLVKSTDVNPKIDIHFVIVCSEQKKRDGVLWLPFDNFDEAKFKRVERCDELGHRDALGNHWQIKN